MTNPASWIGDAFESIKNISLASLILPGTHDSGAYKVSPIAPAINNTTSGWLGTAMQIAAKFLSWSDVSGKALIQTQTVDIGEQLTQGARLLDFRLGKGTDGKLYLSHTFLGEELTKALQMVKNFVDSHPKEIVVINLKIDYAFKNSLSYDDQAAALKLINNTLGEYLNKYSSPTAQIGDLIAANQRIICYSGLDVDSYAHGAVKDILNHEIWPNKSEKNEIIDTLKEKMNYLNYYSNNIINYISLNTTPDAKKLLTNLISSFVSKWLFWQKDFGLTAEGNNVQETLGPDLLKLIANKNIAGITLDNLSPKYIAQIIAANYTKINFQPATSEKIANSPEKNDINITINEKISKKPGGKLKDAPNTKEVEKISAEAKVYPNKEYAEKGGNYHNGYDNLDQHKEFKSFSDSHEDSTNSPYDHHH